MNDSEGRFAGKSAIVTGAASGIGAATARTLLADGCRLVVGVDRDERLLPEIARELGPRFVPHQLDLGPGVGLEAVVALAEDGGGLDILINNAGIGGWGSAAETDPAMWRDVMTVDLDAVYRLSRVAIPALVRSRGCIVNTASISGMRADPSGAAYGAAKAALIALSRSMAVDYGPRGVRVNAVSPGLTDTPIVAQMSPAMHAAYCAKIPLRRSAAPEDIAEVICFLASDAARYVTGQNIAVDGGFTAASHAPNAIDFMGRLSDGA